MPLIPPIAPAWSKRAPAPASLPLPQRGRPARGRQVQHARGAARAAPRRRRGGAQVRSEGQRARVFALRRNQPGAGAATQMRACVWDCAAVLLSQQCAGWGARDGAAARAAPGAPMTRLTPPGTRTAAHLRGAPLQARGRGELRGRTQEQLRKMLMPRCRGSLHLHAAFAPRPLRSCLTRSSPAAC